MPVRSARHTSVRRRPPVTIHEERAHPPTPEMRAGDGGRDDRNSFEAVLTGLEEVPPIHTGASGTFRATVEPGGRSIRYVLTFRDLIGEATAAHIHFGQRRVNGEVVAFLCGGGDQPECPGGGGTVEGTIDADDIMAVPQQGIEAGDVEALLRIMRAGAAYVNVHSTAFPAGEIRGQIRGS